MTRRLAELACLRTAVILAVVLACAWPAASIAVLPGDDEVCYYYSDATSELYRVERDTGNTTLVGFNGLQKLETMEFQPRTNILFAIDLDRLGTLNLESATFTPRTPAGGFGNNRGYKNFSYRTSEPLGDADSLAIHPDTGEFYAVDRNFGPPVNTQDHDLLFKIDPVNGTVETAQFDTDNDPVTVEDFVPIRGDLLSPGLYDIDDMAFVKNNGVRLFGVANNNGGPGQLVQIKFIDAFDPNFPGDSVATPLPAGSVHAVGSLGVDDIEGMSSDRFGNFFGTQGKIGGTDTSTLYDIDPDSGTASNGRVLAGGDVEAVACYLAPTSLALTKTVDSPCPAPGETINYQVVLQNEGPALSSGTIVRDLLPSGVSFVSAAFSGYTHDLADPNDSVDTYDAGTGDWTVGVLPLGESVTMTVTMTVNAGTAGQSFLNTAEVFFTDQLDPDSVPNTNEPSEDDQETVGISVSPTADLSLSKTDGTDTYTPGETLNYVLTVANSGPSDLFRARVTDSFPAGFDSISWTCAGDAGGVCTASGVGDIDELADLPSGATVTYTVTATVSEQTATGTLANTASVAAPTGCTVNDAQPGNNSATDSNALKAAMLWRPDQDSTVQAGATVVYPHRLDILPGNGSGSLSFTVDSNRDFTWVLYHDSNGNGVLDSGDAPWVNGTAPGFTSGLFFAKAEVPPGAAPGLVDVTTITAAYTTGTTSFERSVTDITRVVDGDAGTLAASKEQALDVGCDGTADGAFGTAHAVDAGDCAIYRIRFANTGTAPLGQIVIRDTTPPYTSYVGGSAAFEAPVPADLVEGAISAPGAGASGGLSWTYTGTLAPGASGSVRFAVKVNP